MKFSLGVKKYLGGEELSDSAKRPKVIVTLQAFFAFAGRPYHAVSS